MFEQVLILIGVIAGVFLLSLVVIAVLTYILLRRVYDIDVSEPFPKGKEDYK